MARQPRLARSKFWIGVCALGALILGLTVAWPSTGRTPSIRPDSYRIDQSLFRPVVIDSVPLPTPLSYIIYEPGKVAIPTRAPVHLVEQVAVAVAKPTPKPIAKPKPKPVIRSIPKPRFVPKPRVVHTVVTRSYGYTIDQGRAIAKSYALSRLGSYQFSCIDNIFYRESHWNYRSYNRYSGAYGIPQALPGSKMSVFGSDWRTNPVTQVKWGIHYVNARYGSACGAWSFWKAHSWY